MATISPHINQGGPEQVAVLIRTGVTTVVGGSTKTSVTEAVIVTGTIDAPTVEDGTTVSYLAGKG